MRIAGHDLRNPVCLILIAAELARRQPDGSTAWRGQLESIDESAAQIRRIIDTFLGLNLGAASGRVDVGLMAAAVVRQHGPAAERKGIALACGSANGGEPAAIAAAVARCDATLTYQILANLVSNALKFTPAGGAVTMGVRAADGRVRAEVRDTGPGVPEAERALLFGAGVRLSPRPTGGEESHGHGLAVVKRLAETQGGAVGAEFPPLGGSVFWVELPGAEG